MSTRYLTGDCRELLPTLAAESVHCCVTSPPYWGLRDYGTARWDGGDVGCDHRRTAVAVSADSPSVRKSTLNCGPELALKTTAIAQASRAEYRDKCGKCGARRIDSQIGLEATFTEYVETMVAVFREVRRVLRSDGTLWLNLGDSYASSVNGRKAADIVNDDRTFRDKPFSTVVDGLFKPKDLCGIPWRVAFALQAEGWYLRQDIIWSKPNPMPESVTDRCTKAHEYLFLLSKSPRYYYDGDVIREPYNEVSIRRYEYALEASTSPGRHQPGNSDERYKQKRVGAPNALGRNKRSVWEIATAPFAEAHFATFPPALIEPCIRAGTSEKGCCAKCGAPWMRQTEQGRVLSTGGSDKGMRAQNMSGYDPSGQHSIENAYNTGNFVQREKITIGWSPSCPCAPADADGEPFPLDQCTVLDPFGGAGTTGLVADRLQRNSILIELNPEYAKMAERRVFDDAPLFAEAAHGAP